jgi:uncharacterized protein YciI
VALDQLERNVSSIGEIESSRFIIIFKPGPKWSTGKTIFEQSLRPHAEYMQKLYEQGKVLYAGPFLDNCGGLAILSVDNEAEAHEIIAREPATLDQIFVAEIHPWYLSFDANQGRSLFNRRNERRL